MSARRLLVVTLAVAALALIAPMAGWAQALTLPVSKGRYRLPYQNGTTVRANNDHTDHPTTLNRIDLGGVGGAPYNVVAAADGWIRIIEDDNSLWCPTATTGNPNPCNGFPTTVCCETGNAACNSGCRNNYVWMQHTNGEWTKYTHFPQNSVTGRGHVVNDFIQAGTVLGQQGQIGFASGPHLHFEVAVPRDGLASIDGSGFLVGDGDPSSTNYNRQNRIAAFCIGGTNGIWLDNDQAVAANCPSSCAASVAPGIVLAAGSVRHLQANLITNGPNHVIQTGAGEALQAQTRVTLSPGFRVQENGYFSARIAACDAPGSL